MVSTTLGAVGLVDLLLAAPCGRLIQSDGMSMNFRSVLNSFFMLATCRTTSVDTEHTGAVAVAASNASWD